MNKTNLVSGTIKGIQIVDLGLKQSSLKNSSKKCMIKLKKNKNSSTNNSITNDSIISIKENISNKNTSISSKTKQQTSSISSNQKIRKVKDNNNIYNKQINKNTNKNFIRIKISQKNNNNKNENININNINNNKILSKPIIQKQKYLYNNEPRMIKKILSHSKNKKPNTQRNIIRNTFNNKINNDNIDINNNLNISGNSNSNINMNISASKKDFFINKEKIKSEPNTKRQIFSDNNDFFIPRKNREILTKEQKRKIKLVFKKILTMSSDLDAASFIRSSRHNLEINSSVDSINYRKINKENFGKNNFEGNNNNKRDLKIIKKMKSNNKTYIVSKDRKNLNKINKNNISKKNYNSNNIKNNNNIKIGFNNGNVGNIFEKKNIKHQRIYNSNSLGTINDKYKSKNHKLRNLSSIKNSANDLLNGTLININNKMNSTYNNNNNIQRVHSSTKSKSKSKIIDNNNISNYINKNKRYQNKNNYIKNVQKNIIKNESDNIDNSLSKEHQINIVMIKNGKNFYNNNKNAIKEKEKNFNYNKKEKIDCIINPKNEIMKKIKINNKSSQKKSQYLNDTNINKYKIIKKIKNATINNNSNSKILNLKNDIKFKSTNALNEIGNNTYFHKCILNPKTNYQNDSNNIKNEKIIYSPKHKGQITTGNHEDLSFNKIISIQKIKINQKNNGLIKNNEEKKEKKIISISCSIKNQKESKQKIKVHRRHQSMINNNINNINKNNKLKPQMINIDLQGEFLIKNKMKLKHSVKKFFNKEIPMPAKKIIKKYKKYLKQNEIQELKQLHLKDELVYYLGEILDRINNKENTYAKINQSFSLENQFKNRNNEDQNNFILNRTCEDFRQGKDNNVKKLKNKFDNKSYNDEEGDYIIINGTHLNYRYEILECLGKGSFGEAIKCYDHKNKDLVCIKIINSQKKFQNQAMTEIKILSLIASCDINNDSNNVKFYNYFRFRNHICLVFELLGKNLYEYLQLNNFIGLDINLIKNYTLQMLFSLLFLKNMSIIHCDLKPENILILQNNASQIKVIDFGSSCLEAERIYFYIQSRFYRAPEVLLDLGYGYEIDMWSLGCILYELYRGEPLFPGINEAEQIYLIMEKIGFPPKYIIEHSPKKMLFFDENLKPYQMIDEDGNYIIPGGKKLKDIMKDAPNAFVDFIIKCLKWNPLERITPDKALMHPFIIENMNGAELYKHKLKVKHIKYGINYNFGNNYDNNEINNFNINSIRNKDYNNINLYQNHYLYNNNFNNNNNSNYNKYTKEAGKYRGNSCQTKRHNNSNISIIKSNLNNFNINNFEEIKYINTQNGAENDFIKKVNKKPSYSVTYGNSNGNKYCYIITKKKKAKNNLPLSTEVDDNIRRINITENNENGNGYKRISKYKENKNKLPMHLPKKKSLGRIKNSNIKKQKNFYK